MAVFSTWWEMAMGGRFKRFGWARAVAVGAALAAGACSSSTPTPTPNAARDPEQAAAAPTARELWSADTATNCSEVDCEATDAAVAANGAEGAWFVVGDSVMYFGTDGERADLGVVGTGEEVAAVAECGGRLWFSSGSAIVSAGTTPGSVEVFTPDWAGAGVDDEEVGSSLSCFNGEVFANVNAGPTSYVARIESDGQVGALSKGTDMSQMLVVIPGGTGTSLAAVTTGSGDEKVTLYDPATLSTESSFSLNFPDSLAPSELGGARAVHGGVLVTQAGFLELATGKFTAGAPDPNGVSGADAILFYDAPSTVRAVEAATGDELWSLTPCADNQWTEPDGDASRVWVACTVGSSQIGTTLLVLE